LAKGKQKTQAADDTRQKQLILLQAIKEMRPNDYKDTNNKEMGNVNKFQPGEL
jgi:hypothetical protein